MMTPRLRGLIDTANELMNRYDATDYRVRRRSGHDEITLVWEGEA